VRDFGADREALLQVLRQRRGLPELVQGQGHIRTQALDQALQRALQT